MRAPFLIAGFGIDNRPAGKSKSGAAERGSET
ncbi:hypothetical protein RBY4I_4198 [Rhodobacterales bacterium Y4I]|nr:hypothetical protein RBY4I_4198 [Rhodobacterales bacterium Y4I]